MQIDDKIKDLLGSLPPPMPPGPVMRGTIALAPGSILDFGRPADRVRDGRERFPREDEQ